jgi:23S rRNA (adenine1618-N6)-methyltransferase
MPNKNKIHPPGKVNLHPRNRHRERYDFRLLKGSCPELAAFVKPNEFGDESIDFFNPAAVKMLNKALLKHYYGINFWEIPKNYLCPPIPGRADYIHYVADLLGNHGAIPKGTKIKCLDVGIGANCVYPIIGNNEYGWSFVGSDIDPLAIESARKIVDSNPNLKGKIELRLQPNSKEIFKGIIQKDELIDVVICNPPFHGSLAEAQAGSVRKLSNLKQEKNVKPELNFGGQSNELWCDGGEERFVRNMIFESKQFNTACLWFSSLVAKKKHLDRIYNALKKVEAVEVKTIAMGQGNKTSRIVAWTFLNAEQREKWISLR